jgi:hypothetical protein
MMKVITEFEYMESYWRDWKKEQFESEQRLLQKVYILFRLLEFLSQKQFKNSVRRGLKNNKTIDISIGIAVRTTKSYDINQSMLHVSAL